MLISLCRHRPNTMPSGASDAGGGVYNEIEIYDGIGWCGISIQFLHNTFLTGTFCTI